MKELSSSWKALQYASASLRADKELVSMAMQQCLDPKSGEVFGCRRKFVTNLKLTNPYAHCSLLQVVLEWVKRVPKHRD